MMTEYYTISQDRLNAIVSDLQRTRPDLSEQTIREYCLADWPEGKEHQEWLDTAPIREIADWVLAGLRGT